MDGEFLTKTVLFQGATPQEVEQMLSCLGAQRRVFPKGAYVYHAGEPVRALGVVLSGSVSIEKMTTSGAIKAFWTGWRPVGYLPRHMPAFRENP